MKPETTPPKVIVPDRDGRYRYRAWHIANPPNGGVQVYCDTREGAEGILRVLAQYDFYLDEAISPDAVHSNAQGVERWSGSGWEDLDDENE